MLFADRYQVDWKKKIDQITIFKLIKCINIYLKLYKYWFFTVAISASITTPLDVAKTRIMLSNMAIGKDEIKISVMLKKVYCNYGFRGYIMNLC